MMERGRPPWSLMLTGLGSRLVVAAALAIFLWLAVAWSLQP